MPGSLRVASQHRPARSTAAWSEGPVRISGTAGLSQVLSAPDFPDSIAEQTQLPVLVTDAQERVVWINENFSVLTGWKFNEIRNKHPEEFLYQNTPGIDDLLHVPNDVSAGVSFRYHGLHLRRDGRSFLAATDSRPIINDAGDLLGYVLINRTDSPPPSLENGHDRERQLLKAINDAQARFISRTDDQAIFPELLRQLLDLTDSEYGFIGEVRLDDRDQPWLKCAAISNVPPSARELFGPTKGHRTELAHRTSLFGAALTGDAPVIPNASTTNTRSEGQSALRSFVSLPIYHEQTLVAVAEIANRPCGYDETIVEFLEPLLTTIGQLVDARHREQQRETAEKALRESELWLEETGRVAGVGGWIMDLHSNKMCWSSQTRRIFDVPDDYVPSLNECISFHALEAQPQLRSAVRRCQREGTPWDLEVPFVTAGGRKLWGRTKGQAIVQNGRVVRLIGTFQDITDRIVAEKAANSQSRILEMIASDAPLTEILDSICQTAQECLPGKRVSLLLLDENGIHFLQGADHVGYESDMVRLADNLRLRDPLDSGSRGLIPDQELMIDDISSAPSWTAFRTFAQMHGFRSCWSIPICGAGGTSLGALAIYAASPFSAAAGLRPIVDQAIHLARIAVTRWIENSRYRRSERLLRETLLRAKLGYWLLDLKTGNLELSPEACALIGRDKTYQPSLMQICSDVIHPEDIEALAQNRNRAISNPGKICHLDVRCRMSDGEIRWMAIESVASVDATGQPDTMSGTVQDITERRQADDEREELQAQLSQAQKLESIGRLAGGVAHDFNNMLAVILGHSEMALLTETPDARLREHLEEIHNAGKRSADLTRQLLAFARRQSAAPRVLNLNDSISAMLQMLLRLIGEDIELKWCPGEDLWAVNVDPVQIDQIVANLAVNARDAIAGAGQITIATRNVCLRELKLLRHSPIQPGSYVVVSVADNGGGMDQCVLERMFEPFYTTKALGQGTGLGLATVFGIVQQNQGAIDVHSVPGKGTMIDVYLPFTPEPILGFRKSPAQVPERHKGERILLVEDEPALLSLCVIYLRHLGYDVLVAARPTDAIQMFRDNGSGISLMVTDVVMPEMSGWELASRLRNTRPELPCLFMSGYNDETVSNRGIVQSDVEFLQKPFDMLQLSRAIRRALQHVPKCAAH